MANLTLSLDEKLLEKGRSYAATRGTSLNALIREWISERTDTTSAEVVEMMNFLENNPGKSDGTKWTRDEIYDRG